MWRNERRVENQFTETPLLYSHKFDMNKETLGIILSTFWSFILEGIKIPTDFVTPANIVQLTGLVMEDIQLERRI